MTGATHDKLRRAQDLLRHAIPNGDLAEIVERAVTLLLADLERTKLAAVERPRAARSRVGASRHIPSAVRRAVWKRDRGRCAFVGPEGRCGERSFLEFHHVKPHAIGGAPNVDNLELRCRAHNLHEAELYFSGRLPLLREARADYGPSTSSAWVTRVLRSRSGPDRRSDSAGDPIDRVPSISAISMDIVRYGVNLMLARSARPARNSVPDQSCAVAVGRSAMLAGVAPTSRREFPQRLKICLVRVDLLCPWPSFRSSFMCSTMTDPMA